jgi:polar amino acid transport system permease protein
LGAPVTLDLDLILHSIPAALRGAGITVMMWIGGGLVAFAIGFLVALARRYGGGWVRWGLAGPVEVLRGTPFLIQLFLLYYGGPFIGLRLEPYEAGFLGTSIYGAAYFSEIIRAGLEAVPRGHVEAATVLGLTRTQTVARILVPEMTLLILPSSINMMIILLKETAVLSIITVPELTLVVTAIGSAHFAFVEALLLLALIYWGIVEAASALGRGLEAGLARYRMV